MNLINVLANIDKSATYTCGEFQFGGLLPYIVSTVVTLIQIGVPILLIIWGMMDLGKAVMAQKEDEIKKGQQTFIKRIIAAAIVFFVIVVVKLVVNIIAPDGDTTITNCIDCFVSGNCTGTDA